MAESQMTFKIHRLTPTAKLPVRADEGSVGYDVFADIPAAVTIMPAKRAIVPLGIAMAVPAGHYCRVAPRSGLAAEYGVQVLAGVVDPSYRGEVKAILLNAGDVGMTIQPGQKIAQLILEQVSTPAITEVETAEDLGDTSRGAGGFGSTGNS